MKLKIPPVLQFAIFTFLMWFIKKVTNSVHFSFQYQKIASYIVFTTGIFLGLYAVYSFRKAKTTVNPLKPAQASSLVIVGLYKYTRNPMYVAILFTLIAVFIWFGNLYNLLILGSFVWYITEFQIKPEEKALTELFGTAYFNYKTKVRRWI